VAFQFKTKARPNPMQSVLMGVGQGIQIGTQQALNDALKSRAEMRKVSSEIRGIVSQMISTARGRGDEELVSNLTKYQVSLAIPGAYEDTGSMVKGLIDTDIFTNPIYQPFGAALGVVSAATPAHRVTQDEIVKMGLGVAPAGQFWWISETGVPTLKGEKTPAAPKTRIKKVTPEGLVVVSEGVYDAQGNITGERVVSKSEITTLITVTENGERKKVTGSEYLRNQDKYKIGQNDFELMMQLLLNPGSEQTDETEAGEISIIPPGEDVAAEIMEFKRIQALK
jgi:hypothetical protein